MSRIFKEHIQDYNNIEEKRKQRFSDYHTLPFDNYYGGPIREKVYRPAVPYYPQSLLTFSYMNEQKPFIIPYSYKPGFPPFSSYLTYPGNLINPGWQTIGYVESSDKSTLLKLKARPDVIQDQLDSYNRHFQYKVIDPRGKVDIRLKTNPDEILKTGSIIYNIPGQGKNKNPFKVVLN